MTFPISISCRRRRTNDNLVNGHVIYVDKCSFESCGCAENYQPITSECAEDYQIINIKWSVGSRGRARRTVAATTFYGQHLLHAPSADALTYRSLVQTATDCLVRSYQASVDRQARVAPALDIKDQVCEWPTWDLATRRARTLHRALS